MIKVNVVLALLSVPFTLSAQLPFRVEAFGGMSRPVEVASGQSLWNNLEGGYHYGLGASVPIWRFLSARAAVRQHRFRLRPWTMDIGGGDTFTFEGSGVFLNSAIGPTLGFGLTHRLSVTAGAAALFVSDQSRITCRSTSSLFQDCRFVGKNSAGADVSLALGWRVPFAQIVIEARREQFATAISSISLGLRR